MAIKFASPGITGKAGDWFSLGSGGSTQLHKLMQDFTATGGGDASIEFWPRLRASPTNGDAITVTNPKGLWRLAGDGQEWSHELAAIYGIAFSLIEAL